MNDGTVGIYLLAIVGILSAVLIHWKIRPLLLAFLTAPLVGTLLFQLLAYWRLGHLDPFYQIAVVVNLSLLIPLSALVGGLFWWFRRK